MKKLKRKFLKFIKKSSLMLINLFILALLIVISIYTIKLIPTIIMGLIILMLTYFYNLHKKMSKTKKGRTHFKNYLLITVSICGILIIVLTGLFVGYVVIKAPAFNEENLYKKEATILYDNENNIIAKLGAQKREKISYDDLPQVLIDAIVATEDSRFYQHNGFDLPRFLKASLGQLKGNKEAGGASTLTMQVVRNNFTSKDQSIIRKFTDIYLAVFKLEKAYTKEEILEFYVNISFLGKGAYGVEQACQTYFNKSVRDINLAEASLLAGMFYAPSTYNPIANPSKAKGRQETVLYLMKKHGYIDEKEEAIVKAIPISKLVKTNTLSNEDEFQGYIDTVVEEVIQKTNYNPYNVPMLIYTNMDRPKQQHVNDVISGKNFKFANDVVQTGIAVLGTNDGKIVAIGAGRNIDGARQFNYATMIKRQPGSSIKPFFDYGPGMEFNNWSPYTLFLDQAHSYSNGKSIKNWDGGYMGLMTLRQALDQSRNIPALKAFQSVDNKKILQFVQNVGLKPEIENGKIHEAHAIGGYNGSSPVELAAAYAALGNGGYYIEPYSVSKIEYRDTGSIQTFEPKKARAMNDATAFMLTDILERSVSSGFNKRLSISGVTIAGKSGTTNFDDKTKAAYKLPSAATNDIWAVGYSPDYVLSFWYGYTEISNKYYHTSSTGPVIRGNLFQALGKGIFQKSNKKFTVPDSVIKVQIEKSTWPAMLASDYTPADMILTEYFTKGTEPTDVSPRFAQITTNVTNLDAHYDSTINSYVLNWNKVTAPVFLEDAYFINSFKPILANYTNSYLTSYRNDNESLLGTFGYNIYSKNNTTNELTFINFTENNTFIDHSTTSSKTYVVKTGFSKFKLNQSSGAEITIKATTLESTLNISLSGDTLISIALGETYTPYSHDLIILVDNKELTLPVTETITRLSDNAIVTVIDTTTADTYQLRYSVTYNGTTYHHEVIDNVATTTLLERTIIVGP